MDRAANILSYFLLAAGLAAIGATVYMSIVSYSSLPYWDGWIQLKYPADAGNPYSIDWLWGQYNEHRMPIPKLFLLADLHWFHATQVLLLASIVVIQLLHLALLSWSMRFFGGWRGALWRTGTGLAAFCLFCLSQWENLTWGFQVSLLLRSLFASVSFVGLLLYWVRSGDPSSRSWPNWKYLLLSIAGALGTTWCFIDGNMLWPMLLVAALALGLWRTVLVYALAGALSTALYFYNYVPVYVLRERATPVNMLKFLAIYFGSSWVGSSSLYRIAEVIGFAGLALCLAPLWRVPSEIRHRRPLQIQFVLTFLFCLGTGAATALGRAAMGAGQAFTSRYQSVALLFWCCLGLLLLAAVSEATRRLPFVVAQVVLVLIVAVGAGYARTPLIRSRVRGFKLNSAAMALITGVPDAEQLRWAYWRWDDLPPLAPYLRREHLSAFADPSAALLDTPLESAFHLAPSDACVGAVETSVAMTQPALGRAALRLTGWAWDSQYYGPPASIVVASKNLIIGLGTMGDWRPQDASRPWMTTQYIGYLAYAEGNRPSGPVDVYAILKGSPATACRIASQP